MIWEYYNLLIYDAQAIFADEKFVNIVNSSSLEYSSAKTSKRNTYLRKFGSNKKDPLLRAKLWMGRRTNVIKKVPDYCSSFDWENQA